MSRAARLFAVAVAALCACSALVFLITLLPQKNLYLHLLIQTGIYIILVASLNLTVGYAGQVNLAQAGFFGIGAFTSAALVLKTGLSVWAAMPLAAAVAAAAGLLIAVPSIRTRGVFFGLVTFGFNELLRITLTNWRSFSGGTDGVRGIPAPPPVALGPFLELQFTTKAVYAHLVFLVVLATVLAVYNLRHSRVGEALAATREDEDLAQALGINTGYYKMVSLAAAALFAGAAGALWAHYSSYIAPVTFTGGESIRLLSMLIVGGSGTITGPLIGTTLLIGLPELLRGMREYVYVVYGLLIIVFVLFMPHGMAGALEQCLRTVRARRRPAGVPPGAAPVPAPGPKVASLAVRRPGGESQPALAVSNLSRSFGGLVAVSGVSFALRPGEILGLIGPNGAGKTTLLNLISGALAPDAGSIRLGGEEIVHQPAFARVRRGIVRTFQGTKTFPNLTVLENVTLASHCRRQEGLAGGLLALPRGARERAAARALAGEILRFVGLEDQQDVLARHLSYGHQNLLGLANALAAQPRILLLDEPLAGMNQQEVRNMVRLFLQIRELGISLLFVEHHVPAVMAICDRIVVLNYGQKIAEGTPKQVQSDPAVIAAYLGSGSEGLAASV